MAPSAGPYAVRFSGYGFRLDEEAARVLRTVPDFDAREEPAVAEDFLRAHAESWSDALASAGAGPGEYDVRIDPHQRRALLCRSRDGEVVFEAEI